MTRWGGMISTPDAVLQAMIKRSLKGRSSVGKGCRMFDPNYQIIFWKPTFLILCKRKKNGQILKVCAIGGQALLNLF